jgi:hypothetical protein
MAERVLRCCQTRATSGLASRGALFAIDPYRALLSPATDADALGSKSPLTQGTDED